MAHAFDRYADFTDHGLLMESSSRPLRKSIRVNTLKTSVEAFKAYAEDRRWSLTPVPWCPDGFFLERDNREEALGKDLRHLIGHFYMQEAASMLPAALLAPQPGDAVLDMSAAPGSKTTQIAAMMQACHPELVEGATRGAMVRRAHHDTAQAGVIVANDVQEKRLWTLKASLHRSGVTNVLVTKKVGQWFARHMTERFDRVLCDAPCTAQGTARKDSDALRYCSAENIGTMARLQVALLVSAIHAAKVGGRIVYSTCTLTPEENEGVVMEVLKMLEGKVEVVDPRKLRVTSYELRDTFECAIRDSFIVQRWFHTLETGNSKLETRNWKLETQPLLRLWPQTFDTEGFFCAVLEKKASTKTVEPVQWMHLQERPVSRKQTEDVVRQLSDRYGTAFLRDGERLLLHGSESLVVTTEESVDFGLAVQDYAVGLPYGKLLKDGRVLLDHELATLRGGEALRGFVEVDEEQLGLLLAAKDAQCSPTPSGHVILRHHGIPFGMGLAKEGHLKNNLPRWMVRFG